MNYEYDVFISYSYKDGEIAKGICKALTDAGVSCFFDDMSVDNPDWLSKITEAIVSSRIFLYLGSKNSSIAKITPKELFLAIKHKETSCIYCYFIEDHPLPFEIEFLLANVKQRKMSEHPVNTGLIPDIMNLLSINCGCAPSNKVCGRDRKYANQTSYYGIEGVVVTYYSAPQSFFEEEINSNSGKSNSTVTHYNQTKEWDFVESSLPRTHDIDINQRFEKEIDDNRKEQDIVYSSIFAPSEVRRKFHMLVQIYLHLYQETEKVKTLAQEQDENAERRDYIPLQCKLKMGDKVDVQLNIYGETLLMSDKKSVVWQGTFTKCSFDYFVPKDIDMEELSCVALLAVNDIPVGEMRFITKIVEQPRKLNPEIIAHKYNKVFISYAHKDEAKVKSFHEGLKLAGIDHFFDRAYLKTGDIFPQVIQDYINSADLFVLFWSENASKSEYVDKERKQALERAFPQVRPQQEAKLSIYPMSIEPRAELPCDMKDNYHFGEL